MNEITDIYCTMSYVQHAVKLTIIIIDASTKFVLQELLLCRKIVFQNLVSVFELLKYVHRITCNIFFIIIIYLQRF